MKAIPRLTDLEIKIIRVLWDNEGGLTIQEIASRLKEEKISAPSVTQAMQRMVKKKVVKVAGLVLVVKSYTRVFIPTFSREDFMAAEIDRLNKDLWGKRKSTTSNVAVALMGFLKENNKENVSIEDIKKLRQTIDQFLKEE